MRRPRTVAAGTAVVAAAVVATVLLVEGDDGSSRAAATHVRTAAVERRTLVSRATVDGTLGYADEQRTGSRIAGTVTWLAPEGAVVKTGQALFRVDDTPVILLSGRRPAWRTFEPGMTDGRDVLALERNLRALGYDPDHAMTVDETWTSATTAAVERLQEAFGMTENGRLDLGRVVFLRGARRIGSHVASVGGAAGPAGVVTTTSTRREVIATLSADDQGAARQGDHVVVDLPDGRQARGRITSIGAVAHSSGQDGTPYIDVTVSLSARGIPRLDQAPVSVEIARERRRGTVAVPVESLLARPGGGYGVELVAGSRRRLVAVHPGLFADGWVEVDAVRPGQRVAVPAA